MKTTALGLFLSLIAASSLAAINWGSNTQGDLADGANWVGGVAPVIGGADSAGSFYNLQDVKLTLAADHALGAFSFYGSGLVTADFGNRTLSVGEGNYGMYIIGGNDTNKRSSTLMLVSGTINVVTSRGLYIGNQGYHGSRLIIASSNAVVTTKGVLVGQGSGRSFNGLIVTNGGRFSTIGVAMPIANATAAISSNNYVVLSGPGSMIQVGSDALKIGHMAFGGNNWMTIDDRALCIVPSTILGNSTNVNNNSLSISSGGIMTNTVSFHLGGQNNAASAGSWNQVNVTNNGLLHVTQYMYIGTGASSNNTLWVDSSRCVVKKDFYIGGGVNSFGNQAVISGGGTLEAAASLRIGNNGGNGGRLTLRNASATVGTGCLVGNIGGSVIADNLLVFEGTNSALSVGTDLSVKNGAGVQIVLPPEGRSTNAPFITGSGVANFDGTTRLLIDARALHRKLSSPRTYVLLRNANAIAPMIDAGNMTLEPEGTIKVALSADSKEILFSVVPFGTIVVVR